MPGRLQVAGVGSRGVMDGTHMVLDLCRVASPTDSATPEPENRIADSICLLSPKFPPGRPGPRPRSPPGPPGRPAAAQPRRLTPRRLRRAPPARPGGRCRGGRRRRAPAGAGVRRRAGQRAAGRPGRARLAPAPRRSSPRRRCCAGIGRPARRPASAGRPAGRPPGGPARPGRRAGCRGPSGSPSSPGRGKLKRGAGGGSGNVCGAGMPGCAIQRGPCSSDPDALQSTIHAAHLCILHHQAGAQACQAVPVGAMVPVQA